MDPAASNVIFAVPPTTDPVCTNPAPGRCDNPRHRDRARPVRGRDPCGPAADPVGSSAPTARTAGLRNTMSPWYLQDPSWAPNGSHLLVTMYWAPNWYLAKFDVASGNITLLHPYGGGIIGRAPSYNKAGTRIAYVGCNRARR